MSASTMIKRTVGVATTGALMLSSIAPAAAAPVVSGVAALKSAASPLSTDVRWRGRWGGRWGGAFATRIISGLALGAIASAPYYSYGYAPYGYYGGFGYYGYYGGGSSYYGTQRPW